MDSALIYLVISQIIIGTTSALTKPHIVFVLVDDWGYADVSFRNPAIFLQTSTCLLKLVLY